MSLSHNSRNKHHLKNKSTIIKCIGNGYPNEFKLEPTHQLTYSFGIRKNEKYILQKNNPIYPNNKITNKINFLEKIKTVKFQIEKFDEGFEKNKLIQSLKIKSKKKKNSFNKMIFDSYLNNDKINNIKSQEITKSLIENLTNKNINNNIINDSKENQFFQNSNNNISRNNEKENEIEIKLNNNNNRPDYLRYINIKKNYLSKSSIQKKKISKIFLNKISLSNNNLCNSTTKIYNYSNGSLNNSTSINISGLSSFSSRNSKKNSSSNYFLISEEENESNEKKLEDKEREKIQFSEKYIKSFKNWKISNENKLLTKSVEDHINLKNNIEKIENNNNNNSNIINNLLTDSLNEDFSNLDDNNITNEDLNNDKTNNKNLENLISDSDSKKELTESSNKINSILKKIDQDDQVRIDEEEIILSNNTSLFNTPKNNNNELYSMTSLSDFDKNKNKKTPLLKSAKPYYPLNMKIHKINKEQYKNKNKTEVIKEENILLNNKELKDNFQKGINKKFSNEEKLFKTPISISSNNDYTYSNSSSNNSNNKSNNKSNKSNNLKNKSENSILENEENQPGTLYNQVISEENEELNSENNESPKKKSQQNILRYSDEENEEEIKIDLPNFINEIKKDEIKGNFIEYLNIILINNYIDIRNKIVPFIINNPFNQEKFIDILFQKSIYENKFRPLYAKLCKDLDKCLVPKKEKIKSPLRNRLIDICKKNFKNIKNHIYNKNYVFGNLCFIAELINVQLVSKKVGVQTINNLIEKYNKYENGDDDLLSNRELIKYIYLESIIILLDKFATCLMYYQKDRIRSYDMNFFDKEIKKQIQFLRNVLNKKNYFEIPLYLKLKLINIIEKEKRNWKPYYFEIVNQIDINLIPNIPININNNEIENYENDNEKSNYKKYSKKKKKNNSINLYNNRKNYSDSYDNLYNRKFFEDYDYYNYIKNDNYYDNYQNNYTGFSYNFKNNKNKSSSNLQNKNLKNKKQNFFQKWK